MLRHDNISVDAKPEPASDPLQPELEHSLAGCRREQRTTPVAAEGYEVGLAGLLKSLQSPRHRASLRPANSPLKPKDGLSGPPVILKNRGLKQVEAAGLFGVRQPDVSKMLRGEFRQFSVERLLRFLVALDQDVEIVVKPHRDKNHAPALQVF